MIYHYIQKQNEKYVKTSKLIFKYFRRIANLILKICKSNNRYITHSYYKNKNLIFELLLWDIKDKFKY